MGVREQGKGVRRPERREEEGREELRRVEDGMEIQER